MLIYLSKRQVYSVAKLKAPFSNFTVCFFGIYNRLIFYSRTFFAAPELLMPQWRN